MAPSVSLLAAAYTNQFELVKRLAEPNLDWPHNSSLGYATDASAKARNHDVLDLLLAAQKSKTHALHIDINLGNLELVMYVLRLTCPTVNLWYGCIAMVKLLEVKSRKWYVPFLRTPDVKVFEAMREELRLMGLTCLDAELLDDLVYYAAANGWTNMVTHLISCG
jgi:hypothetical protein